jgi:hypothetical protein
MFVELHGYLESCSSGKQNSRTSLVGMVFTFSDLRAGMESSSTVPRRGNSSLVLKIRLLAGAVWNKNKNGYGILQHVTA